MAAEPIPGEDGEPDDDANAEGAAGGPAPVPGSARRYDAFISYSHAADAAFSRVLHRELEGFGRTSRRERPLELFRDESNLAAGAGLTARIQDALSDSQWLLVLASPEAARSEWVNRELDWWWERHGSWSRLLVAVTGGEVGWTPEERAVLGDRSAIPPSLADRADDEIVWQDLRDFSRDRRPDVSSSAFRTALAGLASPLRGVGKSDLIGFHVEWQRKEIRRGRRIAVALAAAGVAIAVAGSAAFVQGQAASSANVVANARLLSSTALAASPTDDDRAKLLAVEGYRLHQGPRTTAALYRTVGANRYRKSEAQLPGELTRPWSGDEPHGGTRLTAAGRHVVGATTEGVVHWDTGSGELITLGLADASVFDVAVSEDGHVVAASTADEVVIWRDGGTLTVDAHEAHIALGDDVLVLASASPSFDDTTTDVRVLSTSDGAVVQDITVDGMPVPTEIGIDDGIVTFASEQGPWEQRRLADLSKLIAGSDQVLAPANSATLALASNAQYFGYARNEISVFPNYELGDGKDPSTDGFSTTEPLRSMTENDFYIPDVPAAFVPLPLASDERDASTFAISNSGDRYLVAGGAETWVTSLHETIGSPDRWQLTGAGQPDAGVFLTNDTLVTADKDVLTLWALDGAMPIARNWDPGGPSEFARSNDSILVPDGPTVGFSATLAASEGKVAVLGGHDELVVDFGTVQQRAQIGERLPIWRPDGTLLVADTHSGHVLDESAITELWNDGPEPDDDASGLDADPTRPFGAWIVDGQLVLVDADLDVQVRDITSGALLRHIDTDIPASDSTFRNVTPVNATALSPDEATIGIATGATGDDRGAYLVDLDSGRTDPLPQPTTARGILLTSDMILLIEGESVDVLDRTGQRRRSIAVVGDFVGASAVVPGTQMLARVRNDGHLVLFDVRTGDEIAAFPMPTGGSTNVNSAWSTATLTVVGNTIYSASANAPIALWDLSPDNVRSAACRTAGRDLQPDEWAAISSLDPPDDLTCDRE